MYVHLIGFLMYMYVHLIYCLVSVCSSFIVYFPPHSGSEYFVALVVGQLVSSFSSLMLVSVTFFSAVWFSHTERTTSTAISAVVGPQVRRLLMSDRLTGQIHLWEREGERGGKGRGEGREEGMGMGMRGRERKIWPVKLVKCKENCSEGFILSIPPLTIAVLESENFRKCIS